MRGVAALLGVLGPLAAFGSWERLAALPDREGFAAPYAGVSGGALLVGGGANFPDRKPWEGGTKVWYDSVFVLERPGGQWLRAGRLPRPLGYGVSATYRGGVVCAGGSDSRRHYSDCFRLEWKRGELLTRTLASLPRPIANACGALLGDTLYVVGGQETPEATTALKTVYTLDLAAARPEWRQLESPPGPGRILGVAAAHDGALWLLGGAELYPGNGAAIRRYLTDAYRYRPGQGWKRVRDLPRPVTAAPSPAPSNENGFTVLPGDDGSMVGTPQARHPGFPRRALRYQSRSNRWVEAGETPVARVTAPVVRWRDRWVLPSGEARPGLRSPEVWALRSLKD